MTVMVNMGIDLVCVIQKQWKISEREGRRKSEEEGCVFKSTMNEKRDRRKPMRRGRKAYGLLYLGIGYFGDSTFGEKIKSKLHFSF